MGSGLVPVGAGVVMSWVGTLAVALTITHIFWEGRVDSPSAGPRLAIAGAATPSTRFAILGPRRSFAPGSLPSEPLRAQSLAR